MIAARGVAHRAQRDLEHRKKRMHPLIHLALRQPEQHPVIFLGRILLQIAQQKEEPVFRGGEGTVGIGDIAPVLAGLPFQRPGRHLRVKRDLEWFDKFLKLDRGHAGERQDAIRIGFDLLIRQSTHPAPPLSFGAVYHKSE